MTCTPSLAIAAVYHCLCSHRQPSAAMAPKASVLSEARCLGGSGSEPGGSSVGERGPLALVWRGACSVRKKKKMLFHGPFTGHFSQAGRFFHLFDVFGSRSMRPCAKRQGLSPTTGRTGQGWSVQTRPVILSEASFCGSEATEGQGMISRKNAGKHVNFSSKIDSVKSAPDENTGQSCL